MHNLSMPQKDRADEAESTVSGPSEDKPPSKCTDRFDPHQHLTPGYPKLAGRMSLIPETGLFRRFGALNFRNLLYLQNELMTLEDKLEKWEAYDENNPEGLRKLYAHDHVFLSEGNAKRDGGTNQRDMVLKIRELLKEYNHALIQQKTILQMNGPDPYDLKDLQHYIASDYFGIQNLLGIDKDIWGSFLQPENYSKELVCLRPREDADYFSRLLSANAISIIQKCCRGPFKRKPDPKYGAISVLDHKVLNATYGFTSVIASAIPIISIAVLSQVDSKEKRIAVIAGFNVLLALCLAVFTEAKEIRRVCGDGFVSMSRKQAAGN